MTHVVWHRKIHFGFFVCVDSTFDRGYCCQTPFQRALEHNNWLHLRIGQLFEWIEENGPFAGQYCATSHQNSCRICKCWPDCHVLRIERLLAATFITVTAWNDHKYRANHAFEFKLIKYSGKKWRQSFFVVFFVIVLQDTRDISCKFSLKNCRSIEHLKSEQFQYIWMGKYLNSRCGTSLPAGDLARPCL